MQLVVHEVRRQYAGTALGLFWTILQPLLVLGAFFFLFTVLRVTKHAPHGSLGEVAIILSGIIPWYFFIRSFSQGISTLDQHAPLVKQINFPIGVLPFVTVGINLIDFLIGILILLGLAIWQGWLGWSAWLMVPTSVLMTTFLVGLAAIVAPLGAMLRDIRAFIPIILRLGLWISPILYLPGTVPQRFHWVLYLNPLSYFLALIRYSAFGFSFGHRALAPGGPLSAFGVASGIALIFAGAGLLAWRRVRPVAVDYL
jgi:ABC-type polysaccharide/polyol phosphate export permease